MDLPTLVQVIARMCNTPPPTGAPVLADGLAQSKTLCAMHHSASQPVLLDPSEARQTLICLTSPRVQYVPRTSACVRDDGSDLAQRIVGRS